MAAINYCKRNERVLVVDWADGQFDEVGINAFDACFQLNDQVKHTSIDNIKGWNELSHSSELFRSNKNKGIYDLYIEKEDLFFSKLPIKLFPKGKMRMLRKKWLPKDTTQRSLCFGDDLKDGLKEDVVYFADFLPYLNYDDMPGHIGLLPHIKKKVEEYAISNQLNEAIGIHVRYTDKKPTKQLSVLIDRLRSKNEKKIFLSTDSVYVEDVFLQTFNTVILYPKTKPKLGTEGLHQWALYNNEEKLKHTLYKESVVEMFLLSKCKELLYQGNSTFSNISKTYHDNKSNCFDWQKI